MMIYELRDKLIIKKQERFRLNLLKIKSKEYKDSIMNKIFEYI